MARVALAQAGVEAIGSVVGRSQSRAHGQEERALAVVEELAELVDAVERAAEELVALDVRQALARLIEQRFDLAAQAQGGGVDQLGGVAPMAGGALGGPGGGVGVG